MNLFKRQSRQHSECEALELQAHAWVRRLTSGTARESDAQALKHWCASSEAHAQAFKKAHQLWRELRPAAELAGAGDPELAALRAAPRPRQPHSLPRRAFLGGALAASAAAVTGVALMRPPLGLWPSVQEWQADYRTQTGERRRLALARDVTVEMNTRSSIAVRTLDGEAVGIELIDGEAAIDAMQSVRAFTVFAGVGRTEARDSRFEVRRTGGGVCVTCIEGVVQVAHTGSELALQAGQQVTYDNISLQAVRNFDPDDLQAWREGILRFREMALAQVLDEINRYRPGRVVLLGERLGAEPVSGRFHIHDLNKAIGQIQRRFRLKATSLPGGILVLS